MDNDIDRRVRRVIYGVTRRLRALWPDVNLTSDDYNGFRGSVCFRTKILMNTGYPIGNSFEINEGEICNVPVGLVIDHVFSRIVNEFMKYADEEHEKILAERERIKNEKAMSGLGLVGYQAYHNLIGSQAGQDVHSMSDTVRYCAGYVAPAKCSDNGYSPPRFHNCKRALPDDDAGDIWTRDQVESASNAFKDKYLAKGNPNDESMDEHREQTSDGEPVELYESIMHPGKMV